MDAPYGENEWRVEQARYTWEKLTEKTGVSTDDINNRVIDFGFQNYWPSHHPRVIPEPFTPEPAETYSKEDLDEYINVIKKIADEAYNNPEKVKNAPHNSTLEGKVDISYLTDEEKFTNTWRAYKEKHMD
ncbi:MAG: hypothetical protein ACOCZR_02810 [Halanaerobiales bacterium]